MLDLSGWGAAAMFVAMVCALVVLALTVAGLVLFFRPVFRSGGPSTPDSTGAQAKAKYEPIGNSPSVLTEASRSERAESR